MSNLEYINQARKLLTEDYKTKHTNEYNNWLVNHKNSWMQPHIVVPFPPFIVSSALAPFKPSSTAPSEEAVVAKALELYNKFNPTPVITTEKIAQPIIEETTVAPVREPITSADAIHKIFQAPVIVEETPAVEVEEALPVPVDEEIPEVVELPVSEETPAAEKSSKKSETIYKIYADAIYKIFQEPEVDKSTSADATEPVAPTTEDALNTMPQPAEELAKAKNSGRNLPSMLQRLQEMTAKWSKTEEKNV